MASSYTTRKRLEKQNPGENNNAWGGYLNSNAIDLVDECFGVVCVAMTTAGDSTLNQQNGLTDEGRRSQIVITGTPTSNVRLFVPAVQSFYLVRNKMAGSKKVTLTNSGGTNGVDFSGTGSGSEQGLVVSDGTNVREVLRTVSIGGFTAFTSAVITVVSDATTDTTGGAIADHLLFLDASETGAFNKTLVTDFFKNVLANVSARTSVSPSDRLMVTDTDGSDIAGIATVQKLHDAAFGLTAKTSIAGADTFPFNDTDASNVGKKVTLTNLRTTLVGGMAAVQADMETATSNVLLVTPGRQHFHKGHPKNFINWDNEGESGTNRANYNCTGITDGGVGISTITFSTAFSSVGYAITHHISDYSGASNTAWYSLNIGASGDKLAGSVKVYHAGGNYGASGIEDVDENSIACFGDL